MGQPRGTRLSRVKDARGRVVTLLDPYALYLLRRDTMIPKEELADLAAKIGGGWPRRQRVACFLACFLPLVLIVAVRAARWSRGFALGSLDRNVAVVLLANYALGACIVWWWARRNRLKRVSRTMLEHLRCPHCGYDLRMLPVDASDGATVCPECGCAWHLAAGGSA
jgi:hypothetical protein